MQAIDVHTAFKVTEGRPVTSSIKVAEYFGKEHKNVIRDVENLLIASPDLRGLNFELTREIKHLGATTREIPVYWMDRKGFCLLAMGFTGAKALAFKCAFYDEFDRMESALKSVQAPELIDAAQQREIQLAVRKRAGKVRENYRVLYRALKSHFRIPRYTCLQKKDFEAALAIIAETPLAAPEALPAPKAPQAPRAPWDVNPFEYLLVKNQLKIMTRKYEHLLQVCREFQEQADIFRADLSVVNS